jgi:methylamine--corrinoid protein Co-methyltransferase
MTGIMLPWFPSYMALSKLAHLVRTGSIIHAFYNTIYGGSCGGKEGMAIAITGGCILLQMLYMTNTHSVSPVHPFYDNDTTPEIMQAIGLAQQALARNSRLLTDVVITPVGGPGTRTLLYECAAMAIMATASAGHVSGLEARFTAEVSRAACGLSRKEADGLVRKLVVLYEPDLKTRPVGQSFPEVYDPVTIQPRSEWLETYEQVKGELREMDLAIR